VTATQVRAMRWQDLAEVHRIEEDAFPQDAWSLAAWWSELAARPRRDYVVLQESGLPGERGAAGLVGYGGLDLAGETADVMTVAVDPARRGQGHGVTLLEELLDRATRSGAAAVMLEVRADNEAALGLYSRHGFHEVHRRRGYYQPCAVDALVMRKEVGARG